jgi:hypothetical protein
VQLEQLEPQPSPSGLFGVSTGALLESGRWSADLWINHAREPLLLRAEAEEDPRDGGAVIESRTRLDAVFAYGLLDSLQLAVAMPVGLGGSEGTLPFAGRSAEDLAAAGLGDLRLSVTFDVVGFVGLDGLVNAGVVATGWAPTGETTTLEGEGEFRAEARVFADVGLLGFRAAANLGYLARPQQQLDSVLVDDVLRWGVGVQAPLILFGLEAIGSAHGSVQFDSVPSATDARTVQSEGRLDTGELLAGVRWRSDGGFGVTAGAGAGVVGGLGDPLWRGVLQVGYAPGESAAPRPTRRAGLGDGDADGDGVPNASDVCPFEPESIDGERDADGCPEGAFTVEEGAPPREPLPVMPPLEQEKDKDEDGLEDDEDACPDEPEDVDGFEDEDGCPELDDDLDGIPDATDQCPRAAEVPNGVLDADGCPDLGPDEDGDGVGDFEDVCPYEPENVDGVRDSDGCPEGRTPGPLATPPPPVVAPAVLEQLGDADGDGIVDADDACRDAPEDLDRWQDEDGCPEPDNDLDTVLDAQDLCPTAAETLNGFEDQDGCPDLGPDADGDGVGDFEDRCPEEPESRDGVRDSDGCPEGNALMALFEGNPAAGTGGDDAGEDGGATSPAAAPSAFSPPPPLPILPPPVIVDDLDGDGLSGEDDRCPTLTEDADGFADADGCPDPDNDGDGRPDVSDGCPAAAESVNGFADLDGCPDVAPAGLDGLLGPAPGLTFAARSAFIGPTPWTTLERLRAALVANPGLRVTMRVRATESELAKRRARGMKSWLTKRGVAAERIELDAAAGEDGVGLDYEEAAAPAATE